MAQEVEQEINQEIFFSKLRPFCVELLSNLKNLEPILDLLKSSSHINRAAYIDYILFPLKSIMKSPDLSQNNLFLILKIINLLLDQPSNVSIHSNDFLDLFTSLTLRLSPKYPPLQEDNISLELDCLSHLINLPSCSNLAISSLINSTKLFPLFAAPILHLLNIAKLNSSITIKIKALTLIYDIVKQITIPLHLINILPGTISQISILLSSKEHIHSSVIVVSLQLLQLLVCTIFDDSKTQYSQPPETIIEFRQLDLHKLSSPSQPSEWYKNTIPRLNSAFVSIFTLRLHGSFKARHQFALFSINVLINCPQNLSDCLQIFTETAIIYLTDEQPNVRQPCHEALLKIHSRLSSKSSIYNTIKINFQTQILSFPSRIKKSNDIDKLQKMRLLNGYIILLANDSTIILSTSFEKIIVDFISLLEFNYSIQCIEQTYQRNKVGNLDISPQVILTNSLSNYLNFMHLNEETIGAISIFCKLVGYYGKLDSIISCLLEFYGFELPFSGECCWILNQIILGVGAIGIEDYIKEPKPHSFDISDISALRNVDHAFCIYLEEASKPVQSKHFLTNLLYEDSFNSSIPSMSKVRINAISLTLIGISNIAKVLGESFSPFLMNGLILILQTLSDENIQIEEVSLYVLRQLNMSFKYSDEASLVSDNLDYILNAVAIRIQSLEEYPKIPYVLLSVLRVAGPSVIPYMNDIVDDVMDALDEYNHSDPTIPVTLSKVLLNFVKSNINESKTVQEKQPHPISYDPNRKYMNDLRDFINERKKSMKEDEQVSKAKNIDEIADYFSEQAKQTNEPEPVPEEDQKLTHLQSLIFKIITRVQHLLNSDNPQLVSLSLQIISTSIIHFEKLPKILNPYIHSIWPTLMTRLKDPIHYVQIHSLDLLTNLSIYGDSFLSRKITQDVWPILPNLVKSIKTMKLRDDEHSLEYRVMMSIQKTLYTILHHIELPLQYTQDIPILLWEFLDKRYPDPIQKIALDNICVASEKNSDMTWIMMNVSMNRFVIEPLVKECGFFTIVLPTYLKPIEIHPNDFIDNVNKIKQTIKNL